MICFPNAKINIGLHILNKRSDGYHNIETIMYPVDFLFDSLEVVKSNYPYSLSIYNNNDLSFDIPNNICTKAISLLKDICEVPDLQINLIKRIPTGAGLGGGSSDASFLLNMLKTSGLIQISESQMQQILRRLGSDCLFFCYNKPMLASRTGDILEPVNIDLSSYKIMIIDTKIKISTDWAYNNISIKKHDTSLKTIIEHIAVNDWKHAIYNDFEDLVLIQYPILNEIKQHLYETGAVYVSLTGTGGAIYALFNKNHVISDNIISCNNLEFFIEKD